MPPSHTIRRGHESGCYQSSLIAPVGHTPAQVPQEMQASASITYWLSPWEIAPTGHSPSQVPQLTQESEITNAICIPSLINRIKTHYPIDSVATASIAFIYSNTKKQVLQVKNTNFRVLKLIHVIIYSLRFHWQPIHS